jgi:hypothetical protein
MVFLLAMLSTLAGCGGGTGGATVFVDPANTSRWKGTTIDSWIAAASAYLGPEGGTIQVAAGSYTVGASIQAASNVSIVCSPELESTLTATASLDAPLYSAGSPSNPVFNFRLLGCVLDGNRSSNPNSNIMANLTNATNGEISGNVIRNTLGFGVYLQYGNTYIKILDNEIYFIGPLLPGETSAVGVGYQPESGNSDIAIRGNYIHDGSLGITILPSTTAINLSEDFDVSHNRITKMAANGILVYCVGLGSNGPIRDVRTIDNEVSCGGYPANGVGFDPVCAAAPGLLQTGSAAAPDGTGVSYNCATEEDGLIAGNRLHDNFFEGIDVTPMTSSVVNTGAGGGCGSATALCWVSGDLFQPLLWKPYQTVLINNIPSVIESCSSTTSCTLLKGPGNLAGGQMIGNAMRSRTTVMNNVLFNNGHGNGPGSGNGGADVMGYGDSWSGNISYSNNALGFVDQGAVLTTHTREVTFNNDLGGLSGDGITCKGCLYPTWNWIQGYDNSASPLETNVARFDETTYGGYMCRIIPIGPINGFVDEGTDDVTNCGSGHAAGKSEGLVRHAETIPARPVDFPGAHRAVLSAHRDSFSLKRNSSPIRHQN